MVFHYLKSPCTTRKDSHRESDRPGHLRPPDVLELGNVDTPAVKDYEVLVRVRAAAVNPPDRAGVTGVPYIARIASGLRRPRNGVRGSDVAGTVATVGTTVTRLRVGDEVFGAGRETLHGVRGSHGDQPGQGDARAQRWAVPQTLDCQHGCHPHQGAPVLSLLRSQRIRPVRLSRNQDDLLALTELLESGTVTPVIDRTYPLSQTPEAIGYFGQGHARGIVAITM
jgi:NADPH:quinone reductase-like Zn-dependent oxidoreductase